MDIDPVAVDLRHRRFPDSAVAALFILARSPRRWECGNAK
jgi:hypothetical protein